MARYSYDPEQHSPNDTPEAELAINAGDYILVWSDPDEVCDKYPEQNIPPLLFFNFFVLLTNLRGGGVSLNENKIFSLPSLPFLSFFLSSTTCGELNCLSGWLLRRGDLGREEGLGPLQLYRAA